MGAVVSGLDHLLDTVRPGLFLPPHDGLRNLEVPEKDLVKPLVEDGLVTICELPLQPASVLVGRAD
jgi:hypothetical protein